MSYRQTTDSKRYFDWLFQAHLDFLAATCLIEDERCFCPTAFHCQQCIEKALKAYLLYKNHRLYDGHNLTWLCKQAINQDKHFTEFLEESVTLNKYYIETRYPPDIPIDIDYETITRIFEMTKQMLDFIGEQIRFDFKSYHKRKH